MPWNFKKPTSFEYAAASRARFLEMNSFRMSGFCERRELKATEVKVETCVFAVKATLNARFGLS